ncbi:phosphatase PAP2 family protein [Sphingomonas sp. RHCKR7]|uniref:acid phosphatase n=1 Tax=Sphingomonas folli TaxID=2862497 RepID=UPI001C67827C|nr:phosphatase PAP2 family protein [Sphingomonas folli]MBW6527283.1 phosphatase PAP2 family protein [Sphingomonas folli]
MFRSAALLLPLALALVAADRPPPPYLDGADVPDLTRVLPPPPARDEARARDDRDTFRRTRRLAGTPRWALATRDVGDDRFTVFACALGRALDAASAPATARLFERVGDGGMVSRAKAAFAVRRPYLDQPGAICEPRTAHLAANGDYPSGHTSGGWISALILAELVPSRATAILARGRSFGESRYICGSHSRSAVEAGYLAGAAAVSRLHAEAAFRADMEAARDELARLLPARPGLATSRCAAEAAALGTR